MSKHIDLRAPNIKVLFADYSSGVCFRYFPEIEQGKYMYRLLEGERVYRISYTGTNYDAVYDVTVQEITPEGLVVTSPNHYVDIQKWNEEQTEYRITSAVSNEPFLVPYKKRLPNGGWWRERDLVIEPLPKFYEKNKFADIISGKARIEGFYKGYPFKDGYSGKGLFYRLIGGRISHPEYEEKFKRFIKVDSIGQVDMFESEDKE